MTEYKFNGMTFQFNTEAALAMGKDAFMAAHKHVPDVHKAWELIEGGKVIEGVEREADVDPSLGTQLNTDMPPVKIKPERPSRNKVDKPDKTK